MRNSQLMVGVAHTRLYSEYYVDFLIWSEATHNCALRITNCEFKQINFNLVVNDMEQWEYDRISELTRIARERELTPEEQEERAILRRKYIDSFKLSLTSQLDVTYIVDEKGNKTKVERKGKKK